MTSAGNWRRVRISDLARVIGGGTPPTRNPAYWNGPIPWFTPGEVDEKGGGVVTESERTITPAGLKASAAKLLPTDTVLVTSRASIGHCAIAGVPVATNQGFASLVPHDRRSSRFLYYWVLQNRSKLVQWAAGSTFVEIGAGKVANLELLAPDLDAQELIGVTLSDADAELAMLRGLKDKKETLKKGMLQQLLAGRRRLPGFTGEWQTMRFGELASPAREKIDPRRVEPGVPLVELENIAPGQGQLLTRLTANEAVSLKTVFRPGDVLFGKLRAYLRKFWLADIGGLCSTELWALRSTAAAAGPFVRYLVETDRFIEMASGGYGTHMPRSDWGVIRGMEVKVPPVPEQEAIAATLGDLDRELNALRARLVKDEAIRKGLMQELLSGRTRLPVGELASA